MTPTAIPKKVDVFKEAELPPDFGRWAAWLAA